MIIPSHNPPEDGGIKYDPPSGGPASPEITAKIQKRANELIRSGVEKIRCIPFERALKCDTTKFYDYVMPYVLVVGYLGGTVNPYGGYLAVRHADAHIWCEVLLNGEWQRVDPTAVVAPGRLRTGSESRAPAPADLTLSGLFSVGNLPPWLQPLGNGWDYVNMRWNQLVMQYSAASQRQLFAWLGLDWGRQAAHLELLIAGIAVLGISYFLVAVFMRRSPREEADVVAQAWTRCKAPETA